uniref:EF-hand domain-containing protein n=1 Tax=Phasianus colchicus TaxID=9054 RepID=A0A669Q9J5_PHACC
MPLLLSQVPAGPPGARGAKGPSSQHGAGTEPRALGEGCAQPNVGSRPRCHSRGSARCWLCTESCCRVGRGREAAAGRCLQRETQREALHGVEGPRTAIHHYKTPQGAAADWAPMAAAELTPVEMAIETVVTVFVSHTKKEGRMGTMTATAFQELLRLQLPNVMKDVPSLEEQMRMLDVSTDQELTFEEFWQLMGELVRALWREREGRKK